MTTPHPDDELLPRIEKTLSRLCLLPTAEDLGKSEAQNALSAAFGGPPQSLALIEAGATALSKWWAAGAGASILGVWGGVAGFYAGQPDETQRVILWGAVISTAVLVLAITHLLTTDLRGRVAVQMATIKARTEAAQTIIETFTVPPEPGGDSADVCPLPMPHSVRNISVEGKDEEDWSLLAMRLAKEMDDVKFLVARGDTKAWVPSRQIIFEPANGNGH